MTLNHPVMSLITRDSFGWLLYTFDRNPHEDVIIGTPSATYIVDSPNGEVRWSIVDALIIRLARVLDDDNVDRTCRRRPCCGV